MTERIRSLYEMVAQTRFRTMTFPYYRGLEGAVDLHVHVGPWRADPVTLAKRATDAGLRALVFKMSPHPSVEVARLANEAAQEYAGLIGVPAVECYGGIVTGIGVGGVNDWAIRYSIETGGKVIWLPVLSSANHYAHTLGLSQEAAIARGGWWSLDEHGRVRPEVSDVFRYAADHDVAVSFGHPAPVETFALAEEVQRLGFQKAFLDHPLNPVTGLTPDDLPGIAAAGVYLNLTAFEISPWVAQDPAVLARLMNELPADRLILSTDGGLEIFPEPIEAFRQLITIMEYAGVPEDRLRAAKIDNPCRLLGIPPRAPVA